MRDRLIRQVIVLLLVMLLLPTVASHVTGAFISLWPSIRRSTADTFPFNEALELLVLALFFLGLITRVLRHYVGNRLTQAEHRRSWQARRTLALDTPIHDPPPVPRDPDPPLEN